MHFNTWLSNAGKGPKKLIKRLIEEKEQSKALYLDRLKIECKIIEFNTKHYKKA